MDRSVYIYESPDKGKTIFRRKFGETERERRFRAPYAYDRENPVRIIWIPEEECRDW